MRGRILAVRGGALGDFVLTLPSLRALQVGGWEVELLTRPAHGKLAQDFGWARAWRALDGVEAGALLVRGGALAPGWREWLGGFAAVVSWVPDGDGAFQEQVRGCGVGAFYQADWRGAGAGSAAAQLGAGLEPLGLAVEEDFDLFERVAAGPRAGGGPMAFHPGSGSPRKNWALEGWLEALGGAAWARRKAWLVIGGEAEEETWEAVAAGWEGRGLTWEACRGLGLSDLARRLRDCAGFVGHDSGISHLAAACGLPCRLLFGPTDPAVWAPRARGVRVLRAPGGEWARLGTAAVGEWLQSGFGGGLEDGGGGAAVGAVAGQAVDDRGEFGLELGAGGGLAIEAAEFGGDAAGGAVGLEELADHFALGEEIDHAQERDLDDGSGEEPGAPGHLVD